MADNKKNNSKGKQDDKGKKDDSKKKDDEKKKDDSKKKEEEKKKKPGGNAIPALKRWAKILLVITLLFAAYGRLGGCNGKSKEEVALQVAAQMLDQEYGHYDLPRRFALHVDGSTGNGGAPPMAVTITGPVGHRWAVATCEGEYGSDEYTVQTFSWPLDQANEYGTFEAKFYDINRPLIGTQPTHKHKRTESSKIYVWKETKVEGPASSKDLRVAKYISGSNTKEQYRGTLEALGPVK